MPGTRPVVCALAAIGGLAVVMPVSASSPALKGHVGPGFSIGVSSRTVAAGTVKLVVSDRADIHNFHLRGPGVNVKTGIAAIGSKTFTITLRKGSTYRFICDVHPVELHGTLKAK